MPLSQRIVWTALPNGAAQPKGTDSAPKLRLSVHVAPQLETAIGASGTLADYPDFASVLSPLNWADTLNSLTFQVEVSTTGTPPVVKTVTGVSVASPPAESGLFGMIFRPSMRVKSFTFADRSGATMRSFSTREVHTAIKDQYRAIAAEPSLTYRIPQVMDLVQPPGLTNPPIVNVMPQEVRPQAVRSLANNPAQTAAFQQFEAFHAAFAVPQGFTPPPIPPMDFHRAVSSLGNFPLLLRRIGLVFELEFPLSNDIIGSRRIRVLPQWRSGRVVVPRTDSCPWTQYSLDAPTMRVGTVTKRYVKRFMAASNTGEVRKGYLVARDIDSAANNPVRLYNVDVDSTAARFLGVASSAAEAISRTQPGVQGQGVSKAAVSAATERMALPALGQPVISMAINDGATRVKDRLTRAASKRTLVEAGNAHQVVNYAEDLTRGYRVDVWDSVTRQWHQLCARVGAYQFENEDITWGESPTAADEGWVQLGAVSKPEDVLTETPPSEMRLHESVFDWSGWSLVVPRPGNALSEPDASGNSVPTKTFTGPDAQTHDIGHYVHPDLPLDVRFSVPPGTLPRLRFGTTYRFRARAVDLAGNSVAFAPGSTSADPEGAGDDRELVSEAIVHKRYDPVKPPTVVITEPMKPSESPNVIVVRSYTNPDTNTPVTENASRHITPPRSAVTMAEACAGLDREADAGKPMDTTLYNMLCNRDDYDFPMDADRQQTPTPSIPSPIPYLPDRYSRGAALKGLPGIANTTSDISLGGTTRYSGYKVRTSPTSSTETTVTTTRVSFETPSSPWYDRRAFKMAINGIGPLDSRIAGHDTPTLPDWNDTNRLLTVELAKAEDIAVDLSSQAAPTDLAKMGVYQWGMEKHFPLIAKILTSIVLPLEVEEQAAQVTQPPTAISAAYPQVANTLISASSIGTNWMLTPPDKITLVHAVDKPMIKPAFTSRAHMERKYRETHATLIDWMAIHGKSTVKLEVKAAWMENVDDPDAGPPQWGPTAAERSAHAFTLDLERKHTTVLNAGAPKPATMTSAAWGTIPSTGMIVNNSAYNTEPQRHFFGDTKHRKINYTAIATSRFERFFADKPGVTFTETSSAKTLHVPSSARPAPPDVLYIVPTFKWAGSSTARTRVGGGLRVYLGRPWFSSGDDERLAVVMWPFNSYLTGLSKLQPFVTEWGEDPLFASPGKLPTEWPSVSRFKNGAGHKTGLKLSEYAGHNVMVQSYTVNYDAETDRWFADIVIDQGSAYFPFVKLALARYQPYSLTNVELSPVVVADFAQLTPSRTASITWSSNRRSFTVLVSGHTYNKAYSGKTATVTAQIERKEGMDDAIGWVPVGNEINVPMLSLNLAQVVAGNTIRHWSKSIAMPQSRTDDTFTQYRLVVREYQWYTRYGQTTPAKRLVYVDTLVLRP